MLEMKVMSVFETLCIINPSREIACHAMSMCCMHFCQVVKVVHGGWGGWPTGNGKKLSKSQACCLAQLCLAAA